LEFLLFKTKLAAKVPQFKNNVLQPRDQGAVIDSKMSVYRRKLKSLAPLKIAKEYHVRVK
jgi:hypothetical protein